VAKAGEPWAIVRPADFVEEGSDSVGASELDDLDPCRCEVDPSALSQTCDRQLIARPFDNDDRAPTHRSHDRHSNAAQAVDHAPRYQAEGLRTENAGDRWIQVPAACIAHN